MTQFIKLREEDVLDIKHLESGLEYGSTTKMKDKTYSRFRYQGVVFTVSDSDTFVKDFLAGKCHSITLADGTRTITDSEGVESPVRDIQFDSHVTSAQIIGIKTTGAILRGISEGKVDLSSVASLQEAAI
jgi:hypothetical protein